MKKDYCPICGNILPGSFSLAYICPCCGNEADVDDDIVFEDFNKFSEIDFLNSKVSKNELENYTDISIPRNIAYKLLRAKWIRNGCKWYDTEVEPTDWNIKKAKEQLENINIF